jgi:hypothetical protein
MLFPMPKTVAVEWRGHSYVILWGKWWIVFGGWTKVDVLVGWWKPVTKD